MSTERGKLSPQVYARIAGWLYLAVIGLGVFGEIFVRGALVIPGDVQATASHILASESLWRLGIAGDLVMHLCDVPSMLILYVLLKPVNKDLSLLALLANLVQTAVLVANKMNLVNALALITSATHIGGLPAGEVQTLAYLAIESHEFGFGLGLIFFGFTCLVHGYLLYRSGYFPKFLGILMYLAGAAYLVNSFAMIVAPSVEARLFPAILLPSLIGETAFCLWLIVKGLDISKWPHTAD